MFMFTLAANDIFRRADTVADLNCGPYVFGQIWLSMILTAYNDYLFVFLDIVRLTLVSSVSISSY